MRTTTPLALTLAAALATLAPAARADPPNNATAPPPTAPGPAHRPLPRWLRAPSPDDMAQAFPRRAVRDHVAGHATMNCKIQPNGSIADCAIIEQTPPDYDFGAAAISLARFFKITTASDDGTVSFVGTTIRVPIGFGYPKP